MNYFNKLTRCLIIAEIGVNHNGDIDLAKKLVSAAKDAGADLVKFQTYSADTLVSPGTPKVKYQITQSLNSETHYEMLKRLELSESAHIELAAYSARVGVEFISTPYDIRSAAFLSRINVPLFKLASADLVDLPLQRFVADLKVPTMVATGMGTLGEVERVVDIYEKAGSADLLLLHAVSNYPCSDESLNLRVIDTLSRAFLLPMGFSDHSEGYLAAIISIAMGAKVIEKHFTLDKAMMGPDHMASSTPAEFSELVRNVRRAELMLGMPRKACQTEEREMAQVSRKSLTLSREIMAGEQLKEGDIQLMRPGTGISSEFIDKFLGQTLRFNRKTGYQLRWSDIEGDL